MFKLVREEYQRHERSFLNPALWAVLTYHYGVWAFTVKPAPLRWLASKIYGLFLFLVRITSGIRLHREITIGRGLHLIHSGNIQIHPGTVIGDYVGIQQDVHIGVNMEREGLPVIGNRVYIGRGATILGDITIGDGAIIGANSLVIHDVPPNATAVGVPARILRCTRRSNDREPGNPAQPANAVD